MQTLTYGRKKPEAGDDSLGLSGWMQALDDNIDTDDSHSHNGTDSARLDSRSMDAYTVTTGTVWGASIGNGLYRMSIAMPSGKSFSKYDLAFKTAGGIRAYLDYEMIDDSNFYVYTNDNTANYTVLFLS